MKPWYASKTLWLNIVSAVLLALDGALGPLFPNHATKLYIGAALFLTIANAALRVITTQAIGTTGETTP